MASFTKYRLADICEIQIGKTPRRSVGKYWGEGHPWVSISDMRSRTITETKEQITNIAVEDCGCKMVAKGTILLSFKLSIGKVAFAGMNLFTNEAIAALPIKRPELIHPNYLYYALKNIPLTGSNNAAKGSTLNKESLRALQLPAPKSLDDQIRIADILGKVESLIHQRKESLRLLDEFLKSTFLEMFGDPVRNEKGWETKFIQQLVVKSKHSIKRGPFGGALKKEIFVPSGYLVYEQYHALNNDFSFGRYFIDEKKFEELKAFEVRGGDVIVSCSGVYLGRVAIVPENAKRGIINQALLKISLNEAVVDRRFFVFLFSHESFRTRFFRHQRGSGIPNFPPMETFKKFRFIYPPVELQAQFGRIVEKTEHLRTLYNLSLQEIENLFQSLSQKAFKGELNLGEEAKVAAGEVIGPISRPELSQRVEK